MNRASAVVAFFATFLFFVVCGAILMSAFGASWGTEAGGAIMFISMIIGAMAAAFVALELT